MREYTSAEWKVISDYNNNYREDISKVKMECELHLQNEVSAHILKGKFCVFIMTLSKSFEDHFFFVLRNYVSASHVVRQRLMYEYCYHSRAIFK